MLNVFAANGGTQWGRGCDGKQCRRKFNLTKGCAVKEKKKKTV